VIRTLEDIIGNPRFSEGVAWKRHHVRANETIVREGELGRSLYFIEDGTLRVTGSVELDEHRRVQPGICDLTKGEIFGEICLYQTHNRSATVAAVTDGCVLEIDGERLSIYLDEHPVQGYLFLKDVFNTMIDRLGRANQRVENLFAWGLRAHGIQEYL
jgi:CRP-like cAMP-binding protein